MTAPLYQLRQHNCHLNYKAKNYYSPNLVMGFNGFFLTKNYDQ